MSSHGNIDAIYAHGATAPTSIIDAIYAAQLRPSEKHMNAPLAREHNAIAAHLQAQDLDAINCAEDAYSRAAKNHASSAELARLRGHIQARCDVFHALHGRRPAMRNGAWV